MSVYRTIGPLVIKGVSHRWLVKEVLVNDEKVEAVPEFCYLGDILSAGGGCELAAVTDCKSA